jgi:hypothetical protein
METPNNEEYYINRDGQREGIYKVYYLSGKKYTESEYKDGILEKYKQWHPNGNMIMYYTSKNKQFNGEYKQWSHQGSMLRWKYYCNQYCFYIGDTSTAWRDIKYCVHGWKVLTKLIETKKERRIKKQMMVIKNKISKINDCLMYSLIMDYVNWNEKRNILKCVR